MNKYSECSELIWYH